LLQGWNSLLVRPEPLLIKDIKVQVNKQKPNNVCPAQMKHNSDKMTIAPMSSSGARILPQAGFLMPDNLPGLRPAAYYPTGSIPFQNINIRQPKQPYIKIFSL